MATNHDPVLITGGSGFVGGTVARALSERGTPVVIMDLQPPRGLEPDDPVSRVPFVLGDILDPHPIARAVRDHGIKRLVHGAAVVGAGISMNTPWRTVMTNAQGMLNVLETARTFGLGRVVFVGSQSIYGPGQYEPVDEDHPKAPDSPYGTTKLYSEAIAANYTTIWGVDFVSLRIPHIYGPGRPSGLRGNVIQEMLEAAQGGRPFRMETGGDQRKEPVYVKDVVWAMLAALDIDEEKLTHRALNVAIGAVYTWREIAAAVGAIYPNADLELGPGLKEVYPGIIEQPLGPLDLSRAKSILGYEPRYPLDRGLTDFAAWLAAPRP
jgi:nucleoside-diphosphate-sugar epimerase